MAERQQRQRLSHAEQSFQLEGWLWLGEKGIALVTLLISALSITGGCRIREGKEMRRWDSAAAAGWPPSVVDEPDSPEYGTEDELDGEGSQDMADDSPSEDPFMQNRFVIRHAARVEDTAWLAAADRPWDPPLTDEGKAQAWQAGLHFKREQWNISKVFCSPFLRCVQTAAEVVRALSVEDGNRSSRLDDDKVDPSVVKVAVEFALGEVMNSSLLGVPPGTQPLTLDLSTLHHHFPSGTVDYSFTPLLDQLPAMEESTDAAHRRYQAAFQHATDSSPLHNILCVTHGDGVAASVSDIASLEVYNVEYCGYSHAHRPVHSVSPNPLITGEWELVSESNKTGVSWV